MQGQGKGDENARLFGQWSKKQKSGRLETAGNWAWCHGRVVKVPLINDREWPLPLS